MASLRDESSGFTLVEILIVVMIMAIAAMIAIPMMSSAGSVQVQSAANMVAADLEYAKGMAIGRQQNYSVVFDTANESYEVRDSGGSVVSHPVKVGFNYVIDFDSDSSFNDVDISDADFDPDSSNTITFDYLGCPYSGTGTSTSLTAGEVVLQGGGVTRTITVEPTTGFISISE